MGYSLSLDQLRTLLADQINFIKLKISSNEVYTVSVNNSVTACYLKSYALDETQEDRFLKLTFEDASCVQVDIDDFIFYHLRLSDLALQKINSSVNSPSELFDKQIVSLTIELIKENQIIH